MRQRRVVARANRPRCVRSHGWMVPVVSLGIFGILVAYVGVVNASAVKGGEIRKLEKRIERLEKRSEELALQEAALRLFEVPDENSDFVRID